MFCLYLLQNQNQVVICSCLIGLVSHDCNIVNFEGSTTVHLVSKQLILDHALSKTCMPYLKLHILQEYIIYTLVCNVYSLVTTVYHEPQ